MPRCVICRDDFEIQRGVGVSRCCCGSMLTLTGLALIYEIDRSAYEALRARAEELQRADQGSRSGLAGREGSGRARECAPATLGAGESASVSHGKHLRTDPSDPERKAYVERAAAATAAHKNRSTR